MTTKPSKREIRADIPHREAMRQLYGTRPNRRTQKAEKPHTYSPPRDQGKRVSDEASQISQTGTATN